MAIGGRVLPLSPSLVASNLLFSDSPEIGPGSLIGDPSSVITIPTSTSPTAPIFTGGTSSEPSFFSSFGQSRPNTGAIVGGVFAVVAVITIAGLGFFYLRRRRTKAPTSAFVDEGTSPPHNDGAGRKLLDDRTDTSLSTSETQASITSMRVYVRVSMPSLHSRVLM
jgi:LPXTG-motif cell wall-anchored protein